MRTRTVTTLAALVTAAGLATAAIPAQAQSVRADSGPSTATTSTTALSAMRQETVDRANALLTASVKYMDAAGTIRTSTRPSATRNVLEWNASNTNRNEFNDGYASGLDWCGYFVARVWTGENTPDLTAFPRVPTLYLRSQAWRTDAKTPYYRFSATRLPVPGDALIWQTGTGTAGVDNGSATGHIGVVTAVNATTKVVTTVEGNVEGDEINRRTYVWDADGPTLPDKHFMGHTSRE